MPVAVIRKPPSLVAAAVLPAAAVQNIVITTTNAVHLYMMTIHHVTTDIANAPHVQAAANVPKALAEIAVHTVSEVYVQKLPALSAALP